jgi:hypothetical protein
MTYDNLALRASWRLTCRALDMVRIYRSTSSRELFAGLKIRAVADLSRNTYVYYFNARLWLPICQTSECRVQRTSASADHIAPGD